MGNPCRCPSCNKFGSSSLNGYCKQCAPSKASEEKATDGDDPGYWVRNSFKPNFGFERSDSFLKGNYATVKPKYGMQEKGDTK